MMKFYFNRHIFVFYREHFSIVTPYGDVFKIALTENPDNPIIVIPMKKKNINEDYEQHIFEKEIRRIHE